MYERLHEVLSPLYDLVDDSRPSPLVPFITSLLYVISVFTLPKLLLPLKDKEQYKSIRGCLKFILPLWNLLLSAYSFVCIFMVFPVYYDYIQSIGFDSVVCDPEHKLSNNKIIRFWGIIFVWSKFAELFDTYLTILKNPERSVAFLHWYHHFTVLLFTWFGDALAYPPGVFFMLVNGTVHTLMYAYYFFKEIGISFPFPILLTAIQIIQMFLGIYVNGLYIYWNYFREQNCQGLHKGYLISSCAVMYTSYLVLFVRFFLARYIFKKPKDAKSEKSQ